MTLIAMLHYRKNPSSVRKALACAAMAKIEDIDFFYFTYDSVDFKNEKIEGSVYEKGSWKQTVLDFPDVIINISSPKNAEQSFITKQLKKKCIFTSYSVGNKMNVYKKIAKGKEFSKFLIPSRIITNATEVPVFFKTHHKIVIKPVSGNHGKDIFFIEKINQQSYKVIDGNDSTTYIHDEFIGFVDTLIKAKNYLMQPYVECKTKSGLSYDFRLHVQKNGSGLWEITLIYPRISGSNKMVSNVKSGGYRGELIPFLQEEFGDDYFTIKKLLEDFSLSFTKHFENLYQRNFDELGIDVGIDENRNLWIYEVNWRPGSKHREFEVAKRLIPYAIYLATNK